MQAQTNDNYHNYNNKKSIMSKIIMINNYWHLSTMIKHWVELASNKSALLFLWMFIDAFA